MATFYKRGDRQWEATVRIAGFPTLRQTHGSKALAQEWAGAIEASMRSGTFKDVQKAQKTLLRDVIDRYKAEVAPRLANVAEQCRIADVLRHEFGSYALANLEPRQISDYRDRMAKQGKSASTVNHHLNTLSAIYKAAEKDFFIKVAGNPAKAVSRLTPPPARHQRVSDEIIELLIGANADSNAQRTASGGRPPFGEFKAWLMLALDTAMRRGEIAKLEWQYVDFKARTARLPKTKNGEERIVPLSKRAVETLQGLQERRSDNQTRVFKLTAEGFKSAYRRAKGKVAETHPEVEKIRFHDTRREATSRIAKKLPNVIELAAVTGHKKLDVLKGYYRPDPTELADKLDS